MCMRFSYIPVKLVGRPIENDEMLTPPLTLGPRSSYSIFPSSILSLGRDIAIDHVGNM